MKDILLYCQQNRDSLPGDGIPPFWLSRGSLPCRIHSLAV